MSNGGALSWIKRSAEASVSIGAKAAVQVSANAELNIGAKVAVIVLECTNMPPYALPDEATKTTFKTRSSPGGDGFNELRASLQQVNESLSFRLGMGATAPLRWVAGKLGDSH